MGSLLPGWDSDKLDRKDEVEEEDTSQPLGYFAKLERARSVRHPDHNPAADLTSFSSLPKAYSLNRSSVPYFEDCRPSEQSLSRTSAPHPEMESKGGSTPPRLAQRTSFHHPHVTTDWSQELRSLGGQKIDLHSAEKAKAKGSRETWWSHMDAGLLNDRPEEPVDRAASKKLAGFVPQFISAGKKLQYHQNVTAM